MANPVEIWKAEKHGFDVWPDLVRHAAAATPMNSIDSADLERLKWYGFFYRKRDEPGRYMNRIRITAGELAADQAKEIARLAYEFGHGIVGAGGNLAAVGAGFLFKSDGLDWSTAFLVLGAAVTACSFLSFGVNLSSSTASTTSTAIAPEPRRRMGPVARPALQDS